MIKSDIGLPGLKVGKDVHLRGSRAGATTRYHKARIVTQVDEADEI
jgi:hypothetical protein